MKINVYELDRGKRGDLLDTITTTPAGVKFDTGWARGLWDRTRANLADPAGTADYLSDWSNGYVATQRVRS